MGKLTADNEIIFFKLFDTSGIIVYEQEFDANLLSNNIAFSVKETAKYNLKMDFAVQNGIVEIEVDCKVKEAKEDANENEGLGNSQSVSSDVIVFVVFSVALIVVACIAVAFTSIYYKRKAAK